MLKTNSNTSLPKAIILTAISLEYHAIKKHLLNLEELTHPKGNVYERGIFKGEYHDWEVGIAEVKGISHNRIEVVWMNRHFQEALASGNVPITLSDKEKKGSLQKQAIRKIKNSRTEAGRKG
jgi:hypothetical protein